MEKRKGKQAGLEDVDASDLPFPALSRKRAK